MDPAAQQALIDRLAAVESVLQQERGARQQAEAEIQGLRAQVAGMTAPTIDPTALAASVATAVVTAAVTVVVTVVVTEEHLADMEVRLLGIFREADRKYANSLVPLKVASELTAHSSIHQVPTTQGLPKEASRNQV